MFEENVERRIWKFVRSTWDLVLCHFRSAALRLLLDVRTWSVSHGFGGRCLAGREVRGQSSSREEEMEDERISVASSGGNSENASGLGSASVTVVQKSVCESERRLGLVMIIFV